MGTAALCGSGGVLTGSGALEITNWQVDHTVDAQDATSMSSLGWVERVACLKGATGSFRSIGGAATLGAHSVTFKTASVGGYSIAGAILVSQVTVDTDVQGIVSFNHTFSFTGAITVS